MPAPCAARQRVHVRAAAVTSERGSRGFVARSDRLRLEPSTQGSRVLAARSRRSPRAVASVQPPWTVCIAPSRPSGPHRSASPPVRAAARSPARATPASVPPGVAAAPRRPRHPVARRGRPATSRSERSSDCFASHPAPSGRQSETSDAAIAAPHRRPDRCPMPRTSPGAPPPRVSRRQNVFAPNVAGAGSGDRPDTRVEAGLPDARPPPGHDLFESPAHRRPADVAVRRARSTTIPVEATWLSRARPEAVRATAPRAGDRPGDLPVLDPPESPATALTCRAAPVASAHNRRALIKSWLRDRPVEATTTYRRESARCQVRAGPPAR